MRVNQAIAWGVVSLIVTTPLAVGSVEPWAFASMEVMIFVLVAFWLLKQVLGESRTFERRRSILRLILPALLFVLMIAIQIVPLPPRIEAFISPSSFELYQKSLPGWPGRADRELSRSSGGPSVAEIGERVNLRPRHEDVGIRPRSEWRSLSIDSSLTAAALLKLLAYLCVLFLVVSYPPNEKGDSSFARQLLRGTLIAGAVVASIALLGRTFSNGKALWVFTPYDWQNGNPWGLRAASPFANPDHLANYLDLVLPIALAVFFMPACLFNSEHAAVRSFCGAAVVVISTGLLLTSSRGGWLGAVCGFAVLVALWPRTDHLRSSRKVSGMMAWASLGLVALLVLLLVGPAGRRQTDVRLEETVAQDSLVGRLQPARMSLGIVRDFPLFGVGLGSWPEIFPHYSKPPWSPTFWNAAHNDYIQLAAETGIIGFGLFAWFLVRALGSVWHGIASLQPESQVIGAACLAGIVAAGAHELIDFPLQVPANALLFTVLLGIAVRMMQRKERQPSDDNAQQSRLLSSIGLLSAIALVPAAITQSRTPYPYNLRQPATVAQAAFLEQEHPANARLHLMLARILDDASEKRRMEELRAALWLEPTNPLARDVYAQALLRVGDKEQALSEISRSISYSPALDSHFYLGPRMIQWLSLLEQEAVEQGFRIAVANRYEGAVQNFASYYDALGHFSAEAAVYREAAMKEQDRVRRSEYFVDAGTAYAKAGELEKAEVSFNAASVGVPEDPTAYEQLILQIFGPRNNLAMAEVTVAQGIERGADPFSLYLALASAAQMSGDKGEAEVALQKAIAARPSSFEALVRIGALDLANNKFGRAATWLRKATQVDPSSAEAFYELGLADEGAYEYVAADEAYKQALALAPTDDRFKTHYAAFRGKLAQNKSDAHNP